MQKIVNNLNSQQDFCSYASIVLSHRHIGTKIPMVSLHVSKQSYFTTGSDS